MGKKQKIGLTYEELKAAARAAARAAEGFTAATKAERVKMATPDLHTPKGVAAWAKRCGWTLKEAAEKLETPYRTFLRWKVKGLPLGSQGTFVARRMAELEKECKTAQVSG